MRGAKGSSPVGPSHIEPCKMAYRIFLLSLVLSIFSGLHLAHGQEADLVPGAITPFTSSAQAGEEINIQVEVENQGEGTTGSGWVYDLYLSTDQSFNVDDTFLERVEWRTQLSPGDTQSDLVAPTLPSDIVSGDYYVVAYLDAGSSIPESDNVNNIGFSATQVTVSGTTPAGDLQVTVNNVGSNTDIPRSDGRVDIYDGSLVL